MYLVSQYIPLSDAEAQAIAYHDGKNERNYYVIHNQIRNNMMIAKQQVFDLIKDLPDELDIDEIMYRLYVRQKLETAEKDVQEGRIILHEEVVRETSKWFEK
jgi:translation initiation factor 2 beta subunit (eIF-2beta)/eIF-5